MGGIVDASNRHFRAAVICIGRACKCDDAGSVYLARTDQPSRVIRGVEAMHAADGIAAWRWWTLAELDSTAAAVWPSNLADLIRQRTGGT